MCFVTTQGKEQILDLKEVKLEGAEWINLAQVRDSFKSQPAFGFHSMRATH
jgi:hypothetical protein